VAKVSLEKSTWKGTNECILALNLFLAFILDATSPFLEMITCGSISTHTSSKDTGERKRHLIRETKGRSHIIQMNRSILLRMLPLPGLKRDPPLQNHLLRPIPKLYLMKPSYFSTKNQRTPPLQLLLFLLLLCTQQHLP
jgi:hypothetical protein